MPCTLVEGVECDRRHIDLTCFKICLRHSGFYTRSATEREVHDIWVGWISCLSYSGAPRLAGAALDVGQRPIESIRGGGRAPLGLDACPEP